jgi:hypothetical protein
MWLGGKIGKVFVVTAFTCSCATLSAGTEGKCRPFLEALARQSPEAKAEASVASGAPYLLGVRGFTVAFPGADEEAAAKIGYRIIEGTSDAFEDDSCQLYQLRAEKYASRFNRRLLRLIANPRP